MLPRDRGALCNDGGPNRAGRADRPARRNFAAGLTIGEALPRGGRLGQRI